jgi:TonB family protein
MLDAARCLALISMGIAVALGCAKPPPARRVEPKVIDPQARESALEPYQAYRDALARKDEAAAIEHGRAALKAARTAFGRKHPETAVMEVNLALVLVLDRAFDDEARELLEHAIGTLHATGVLYTRELVLPYVELGRLQRRARDYGHARQSFQRAVYAIEALVPKVPDFLVKVLLEASGVEDLDREPRASEQLLQRAAAIARARSLEDPFTAMLVVGHMAEHALVRGRPDAALDLYLEAAALFERTRVRDASPAIEMRRQIAALYEERGDAARAGEQRRIAVRLGGEGEIAPVVRVEPEYPRKALQRGEHGAVLVGFIVDAEGRVSSARVADSDPPGVFDDAARAAVRQFVYTPRVIDGEPTQRRAMRVLLRFRPPRAEEPVPAARQAGPWLTSTRAETFVHD